MLPGRYGRCGMLVIIKGKSSGILGTKRAGLEGYQMRQLGLHGAAVQ